MPLERARVRHDLARRALTVAAVRPLGGPLVRVTLTGDDLEGFAADGPADHVRVGFPAAGDGGADAVTRDYTPLAFRPRDGATGPQLDLDFVLHGDDGPASRWAAAASVGDELTVGGPRGSQLAPDDLERLVLVVDETGFPAARRWISATTAPVEALLIAGERTPRDYFDDVARDGLTATWLADASAASAALAAAAPFGERTLVFLAGEAGALVPLRRHLRRELGLGREQVDAHGYWRRGVAGLDHHAPLDPDDPE